MSRVHVSKLSLSQTRAVSCSGLLSCVVDSIPHANFELMDVKRKIVKSKLLLFDSNFSDMFLTVCNEYACMLTEL